MRPKAHTLHFSLRTKMRPYYINSPKWCELRPSYNFLPMTIFCFIAFFPARYDSYITSFLNTSEWSKVGWFALKKYIFFVFGGWDPPFRNDVVWMILPTLLNRSRCMWSCVKKEVVVVVVQGLKKYNAMGEGIDQEFFRCVTMWLYENLSGISLDRCFTYKNQEKHGNSKMRKGKGWKKNSSM